MKQWQQKSIQYLKTNFPFIVRLWREFQNDNCTVRAFSLAYATLLALVPLAALVFSLFTAFGAFEQAKENLQELMFFFMVPDLHEDIIVAINGFIDNAGTLGVVGLVVFSVTSVSLLNSINANFNALWGSTNRKSFIAKFTTYTSVIIFGTIFLGASFTLASAIRSLFPDLGILSEGLLLLAPGLFTFLTIFLMINTIPTGRVSFKSSLIGALSGTILWEVLRFIFVDGTSYVIRISTVYGSLAAIPIFLYWLFITWLIILVALEITYVHQHMGAGRPDRKIRELSPGNQLYFGLTIYFYISRAYLKKDQKPISMQLLAKEFSVSPDEIFHFAKVFQKQGLLYIGKEADPILLPMEDLGSVSMRKVLETLLGYTGDHSTKPSHLLNKFFHTGADTLSDLTVKDFLNQYQD